MQIELLPAQSLLIQTAPSILKEGSKPWLLSDQDAGGRSLSALSHVALKQGWSEVQFSAESSKFAYRRDGSLALSVHTRTSLIAHLEEVSIEIKLPASLLGEGIKLDSPLTIELQAWDQHLSVQTSKSASFIRPTRRVEEILTDILQAVREAFGHKGVKSLTLLFDEEALRILSADEKLRKAIQDILALVQMINALRQDDQEAEALVAHISGKGKPYWQVTQDHSILAEEKRVTVKLIFEAESSAKPDSGNESVTGDS